MASEPTSRTAIGPADDRLARLLEDVVARRMAGEDLSDEQLIRRHPELMPELSSKLGELRRVEAARRLAENSSEPPTLWRGGPPREDARSAGLGEPEALAGYQVIRELHRGGQGVVYLAVRKSTGRQVAVKVMREGPFAGPRDVARFDREVSILARLDHPSIVGIHDSGVAAGHHYFVMDYVDGVRLDQWADRFLGRGGAATDPKPSRERVRGVLDLFASVCDAVSAAHVRGVIHRDLKPANILVCRRAARAAAPWTAAGPHSQATASAARTESEDYLPRILDFGLAKLSEQTGAAGERTLTGQFIGSLPWSSPEQARGAGDHVDLRTDVYSLGVVLYQLLTGAFPYDVAGNLRDAVDNILHAVPIPPRRLNRSIDDEVETIVLKCLEKSPDRRYQTAGDLARELRRYRAGQPIEAKRDSGWYLLRKSLSRHRLAASIALAFVLLVTVSAGALFVMYRAQSRLRVTAERHARQAEQTTRFLRDMLASADPNLARGRDVTVREVLDAAAAKLSGALTDDPAVAAAVHRTLGTTYQSLGQFADAEKHHRAAMELTLGALGEDHVDTLAAMNGVATAVESLSRYDEAEALYRHCIDLIERRASADPVDASAALEIYHNLGNLLRNRGRFDEAEPILARVLEESARVLGQEDSGTLITKKILAAVWMDRGEYEQAETAFREVLEVQRRTLGNNSPLTLGTIQYLAMLLKARGRLDEAEPLYREAAGVSRVVLGDTHPDTLRLMNSLGRLLQARGNLAEAEQRFRDTARVQRETLGPVHFDTLVTTNNLSLLLQEQGRFDEAEPLAVAVEEAGRRALGSEHPDALVWMNNLSSLYARQGRWADAEPLCREVLDARRRVLGADHPATLNTLGNLALLLSELARHEEAVPLARQALEARGRILGEDHPDTLLAMSNLARVLMDAGPLEEAEELARKTLDARRRVLGDDHPETLLAINNLGRILVAADKAAEAEPVLRAALEAAELNLPARHWYTPLLSASLGKCLARLGRTEEAALRLKAGCEGLADAIGPTHARTRDCLDELAALYEQTGDPQKAAEIRAGVSPEK
ncbi:MAG: hypothetical protein DCC65_11715 [Planctomycetota bacterium]|nr:MAG: hypothetical protein DCC65_11715 [Planctomycetota bacterium]